MPGPGSGDVLPGPERCQAPAQTDPFSAKEAGGAVLPVWLAWRPIWTEPPGASVPLYATFLAVTAPLLGLYVAPQPEVMVWPAGRVKASDQLLIAAAEVLVRVRVAVRPVFQTLVV